MSTGFQINDQTESDLVLPASFIGLTWKPFMVANCDLKKIKYTFLNLI